jgi:PAS domain S-box-containing protein
MGKELKEEGVIGGMTERKPAEEALEESERRYRSLFEGIPIGLYRTTPAGQVMDANPALVVMLGYPDLESLLGSNVVDTYTNPETRMEWQKLIEREGGVRNLRHQLRCFNGSVIWVEENARVVRGENDEVLYYEGSIAREREPLSTPCRELMGYYLDNRYVSSIYPY